MQSLECVELLLFVLLPKMSVPDIKNMGLPLEMCAVGDFVRRGVGRMFSGCTTPICNFNAICNYYLRVKFLTLSVIQKKGL